MWTTSQAGVSVMLNAADSAARGQRREDALDAFHSWIGAAIRLRVIQDIGGSAVVVHHRTHNTGMSRTDERLILPTSGWTVLHHQAFNPGAGPLRVRVERTSDATRYAELGLGAADSGSISGAVSADDTIALNLEITAFNIDDPEDTIPAPPADFSYRIYDNVDVPVSVQPSLVGMHFTNAANIGGSAPENTALPAITGTAKVGETLSVSDGTWTEGSGLGYAYDTFRTLDCPGLSWSAIETSAGVFDWTAADAAIDAAYNAGKRILFVVHSPPSFAVQTEPYPGDPATINRFLNAVLTRYAAKLWAIQYWSRPDLSDPDLQGRFARGHVLTYLAARNANPNILVFLSGARTSGESIEANQSVIDMGVQIYQFQEARNAADVLSFQNFGPSPSVGSALACFRSLAATRSAMRPALKIAVDMCGADATSGSSFTEAQHIQVIQQLLLLGVGFGAQVVGLYAHERQPEIGNPSANANIRAAINAIHSAIGGKQMVRAYVLTDGAVWIAFADGTTIQSPGGTYVPPVDPDPDPGHPGDPDRDFRVHPFAINDVTNLKIGNTSTYATTSDKTTNLVRASVGFNGSVSGNQNSQWSIPKYIGLPSDPLREVRVYPPGASSSSAVSVHVRIPDGALPSRPWVPRDGHFTVINGNTMHEFWYVDPTVTPWRAGSYTPAPIDGASWGYGIKSSNSNPTVWTIPGMAGWGSCRAFGGSENFGLIMPAELQAGLIPHVIGFAQRARDLSTENAPGFPHRWIWPATRDDGAGSYTEDSGGVRQGQCFAIPKSVNIDAEASSRGWTPYVKTIAKALQDYGAICIDQSGSTCIYLELTTRTSTTYAGVDSSAFRTGLNQAWGMLRRITNHTQATPKGNTGAPPDPDPPGPDPEPPPPGSLVDHPFRSDSPWNTPIPSSAIWRGTSDPRTARIRSNTGGPSGSDSGPIVWALNSSDFTFYTYYATNSDPWVTVTDAGGATYTIRCPANAVPSTGTDRHLCIVDPDGMHSHDFVFATRSGNTITTGGYIKTRLDGMGWRMTEERLRNSGNPRGVNFDNASAGRGGPRAVSAAGLGGLIRRKHLDDGVIPHALGFACPRRWAKGGINVRIWPADEIIGWGDSDDGTPPYFSGDIRYSDRFGLDKNVNVDSLSIPREWKIIAKALQVYGMYLVDVAGIHNPCLYAEFPAVMAGYPNIKSQQGAGFAAIVPHLMALDWY